MLGFSLSPGGLLLPYHIGALASLEHNGYLKDTTPLAGSSAGSIAVVAHACNIDSRRVLDATIQVSEQCKRKGGARGNLLSPLREALEEIVDEEAFQQLKQRQGMTGVAYRQVFPQNIPILQTDFESRDQLIQSVLHSSTFPFFTLNWPCAIDMTQGFIPRLMVDGYFTVPRNRFGCPDFDLATMKNDNNNESGNGKESKSSSNVSSKIVDRTVTVSVFPHDAIGIDVSEEENQISPLNDNVRMGDLFELATEASSPEALMGVYESGWADAERWCLEEDKRRQQQQQQQEGQRQQSKNQSTKHGMVPQQ
mmetsp:Transcript_13900/g.21675  ORF Transcript_13900/g.21675 Transcript_13900/m.21675 type:complete len:309 (+) Transcript_13900:262-1188(+)|eukprot:CAMPEP_0195297634 /NCGR_PEP_ID=MMETSP0707-20130614/21897_1 /TAXON_ID=33640 /ORGANISM="Asterionellopsis glacialis, Strain CCMP134" /LENGTH=308 /DNA_ID=CAMNT_0040359501 /DNA_START=169 /DNA_END=1095 /DNA_ORIENTATION=+